MSIIAISGKKQHGKDTVAKIIEELTAESGEAYDIVMNSKTIIYWTKRPFARKLKLTASMLLNVNIEDWESEEFKETIMPERWWYKTVQFSPSDEPPTPEIILADAFNTGKSITPKGEQKWTNQEVLIKPTYRSFLQKLGTDVCRSIHPDFWINSTFEEYKEYYSWLMPDCRFPNEVKAVQDRSGLVIRIINPRLPKPEEEHRSETALDDYSFEHVIINDGTIEDLKQKVTKLLLSLDIISPLITESNG